MDIELPDRIHATVIAGERTDVISGQVLRQVVVWADRVNDTCPLCGQRVAVEADVPVDLHAGARSGGQLEEWSQQHGCGEWLHVDWIHVPGPDDYTPADEEAVRVAASDLVEIRRQRATEFNEAVRKRLLRDLREARERVAELIADGESADDAFAEVRTGSDGVPGIHVEAGLLVAWDYAADSTFNGDIVEATEQDLTDA